MFARIVMPRGYLGAAAVGRPGLQRAYFVAIVLAVLVVFSAAAFRSAGTERSGDRLVVLIIVDQLRGDFADLYPTSLREAGGLTAFLDHGTVYENAYYPHAITATAPGHATIATGAHPSTHGIVGNDWFDPELGRAVTSVGDASTFLIGPAVRRPGASPANLRAPTVGDELVLASGGKSKVISVSGKDRGAVLTAGQLGKAFWFSQEDGQFVTSSYYGYSELPDWVARANDRIAEHLPSDWRRLAEPQAYRFVDDRQVEAAPYGMGAAFPHPLPRNHDILYFEALKRTPHFDDMTLDLALSAVHSEQLGQDDAPDLLVVSLSATDYVQHAFGVFSVEAEDNIRRLNASLGRFIESVQQAVGRRDVTFALVADHGGDAIPDHRKALRGPGHRIIVPTFLEHANAYLSAELAVDGQLLAAFQPPTLFVDWSAVSQAGLARSELDDAVVRYVEQVPGVLGVSPTEDLSLPPPFTTLARNSIHPGRSGDFYVLQDYATFLGWDGYSSTHGSADNHDRHVPLMFLGARVESTTLSAQINVNALSATIARCLRSPIPAYATDVPLDSVCGSGSAD